MGKKLESHFAERGAQPGWQGRAGALSGSGVFTAKCVERARAQSEAVVSSPTAQSLCLGICGIPLMVGSVHPPPLAVPRWGGLYTPPVKGRSIHRGHATSSKAILVCFHAANKDIPETE